MSKPKVVDVLEDLIDDTIVDEDWQTCEFYQDLLAVCLVQKNKVARRALKLLVASLAAAEDQRRCKS